MPPTDWDLKKKKKECRFHLTAVATGDMLSGELLSRRAPHWKRCHDLFIPNLQINAHPHLSGKGGEAGVGVGGGVEGKVEVKNGVAKGNYNNRW